MWMPVTYSTFLQKQKTFGLIICAIVCLSKKTHNLMEIIHRPNARSASIFGVRTISARTDSLMHHYLTLFFGRAIHIALKSSCLVLFVRCYAFWAPLSLCISQTLRLSAVQMKFCWVISLTIVFAFHHFNQLHSGLFYLFNFLSVHFLSARIFDDYVGKSQEHGFRCSSMIFKKAFWL